LRAFAYTSIEIYSLAPAAVAAKPMIRAMMGFGAPRVLRKWRASRRGAPQPKASRGFGCRIHRGGSRCNTSKLHHTKYAAIATPNAIFVS
jgi:hypothetical protein